MNIKKLLLFVVEVAVLMMIMMMTRIQSSYTLCF